MNKTVDTILMAHKVNMLAFVVFIVLQILFVPLAIIGVILVAYRQMWVSRKLGVSQTAVEVINGRWAMDCFGIREDHASVKLNRVLPNNSVPGMWLALFPLYVYHKISGKNWLYPTVAERGEEGVANIVINRTLYFDEIIYRAKVDAEQFVVMGAGFDTRCYGDLKDSGLTMFELDQANTQRLKREYLAKASVDASHVHFVEVDFATDYWVENLKAAGYDPSKKTLFLWEGVTLYLGENDVRNTLSEMKANSATGSIVVADFYAQQFVTGEMYPGMKTGIQALKITDEAFGFGLDFADDYAESLKTFLASEGATVGDTYFMGSKNKKGTWMVVAEAII